MLCWGWNRYGQCAVEGEDAVTAARSAGDDAPAAVVDAVRTSPTFGAFAVAWVAAKFTEPARLVVTLFLVPRVAAARAALASALALTPR